MENIIKKIKKEVVACIKDTVNNTCEPFLEKDCWFEIVTIELGSIDVNFWSEDGITYHINLYDVVFKQGYEVSDLNTCLTIFSGRKETLEKWMTENYSRNITTTINSNK